MKFHVKGTPDFTKKYTNLPPSSILKRKIDDLMDFLSVGKSIGNEIKKRRIPRKYKDLNNLFRYRLNGERILYTLITENGKLFYVILDLLSHNEYDKVFGYRTS